MPARAAAYGYGEKAPKTEEGWERGMSKIFQHKAQPGERRIHSEEDVCAKPDRCHLGILIFTLMLLGTPGSGHAQDTQDTVTAAECAEAYQESSADPSCIEYEEGSNLGISVSDNDQCVFSLKCRNKWWTWLTPLKNWNYTNITVDLGDADNLSNCNGQLRVGSC